MSKLSIRIKGFRPHGSNTLHGFVDLAVPEMRIVIAGAPVHEAANGRRWINLPGKPLLNSDECAERDERGKIVYQPIVHFDDREVPDRFSDRAVEALFAHPNAFDPET